MNDMNRPNEKDIRRQMSASNSAQCPSIVVGCTDSIECASIEQCLVLNFPRGIDILNSA